MYAVDVKAAKDAVLTMEDVQNQMKHVDAIINENMNEFKEQEKCVVTMTCIFQSNLSL
jgi:hypothetical protein